MSRKSLILGGESAGIRTQDPRLKRASGLVALTKDQVRLSVKIPLRNAWLQVAKCAGLRLRHIGNRDQNRDRTVTKTVTKNHQTILAGSARWLCIEAGLSSLQHSA